MKAAIKSPLFNIILFTACAICLCACSSGKHENATQQRPLIVVTTNIMADVIRHIAGDSMEVISIMSVGVDPHLYKATQRDFVLFKKADIIFYNGLHLEGKLSEALNSLARQKPCYALGDALPKEQLIQVGASTYDPHIWFDPFLMKLVTDEALNKLVTHYPSMKSYLNKNADLYKQAIDSIHKNIVAMFEVVPEQRRILITAHDAFEYYGRRYKLQVKGLQGISTISEAGLYDVMELVNYIIENDVKAIFAETTVSPKALQSVVEGCKSKGHTVKLVTGLYSDSLGDDNSPANTYLQMILFNTQLIVDNIK